MSTITREGDRLYFAGNKAIGIPMKCNLQNKRTAPTFVVKAVCRQRFNSYRP